MGSGGAAGVFRPLSAHFDSPRANHYDTGQETAEIMRRSTHDAAAQLLAPVGHGLGRSVFRTRAPAVQSRPRRGCDLRAAFAAGSPWFLETTPLD